MIDRAEALRLLALNAERLSHMGARRIGLFGSVAAGTARPDSDVDILVDLDELTFDRYMDLKIFLEDLFQSKVDLVPEKNIRPALRDKILAEVVYVA